MKKLLVLLFVLLFPIKVFGLSTSAQCVILMEQNSHRTLYSNNEHHQRLIASITKIMTAVIAIESGKLDDKLEINDSIKDAYGSGIYIEVGEKMTLRDLVYGLLLRSGNDAALAIADYVGGSEEGFVQLMNEKAKQLLMRNSKFQNPHGLDQTTKNYSTAYDMAILTSYAMTLDEYRKIISTKKYTLKTNKKSYIWYSKNKLLDSYEYATGGKTGYTDTARRTLVTTASNDNLDLVVVTLNDPNDWKDHRNLYDHYFELYKTYRILNKDNFKVVDDYFYKDELYIKKDFKYPLQNNEIEKIYTKAQLVKLNNYKNEDVVGTISVYLNSKVIHTQNIYVKKEKSKKNLFQKIIGWFK
ncbi:MAG: D-alanyl-D-alanine carboxypeptidase family protein [Bacilli bacterium]